MNVRAQANHVRATAGGEDNAPGFFDAGAYMEREVFLFDDITCYISNAQPSVAGYLAYQSALRAAGQSHEDMLQGEA